MDFLFLGLYEGRVYKGEEELKGQGQALKSDNLVLTFPIVL